jgi:hypothetical protein
MKIEDPDPQTLNLRQFCRENTPAYLSRLCEKHDVKVAHFVPSRGANVGVVVHVGAVVRAPAIQKSTVSTILLYFICKPKKRICFECGESNV